MTNFFETHDGRKGAPWGKTFDITPDDTEPLETIPACIWVGVGGHITGRCKGDTEDRVWKNAESGSLFLFEVTHIRSTGTTATDLVGCK